MLMGPCLSNVSAVGREVDLVTLNVTQLFDLVKALNIPATLGEQPHFKAAHSMAGWLYGAWRLAVVVSSFVG